MTCTVCGKRTDGQPIITMHAQTDSATVADDDRFTGIVWCVECIPASTYGDLLRDEIGGITRRNIDAARAPLATDEVRTLMEGKE